MVKTQKYRSKANFAPTLFNILAYLRKGCKALFQILI